MSRAGGSVPIAVEALEHGFGENPVLEDISVSIESGETFVVIGPSGTGKTTLLRLLALFERPHEGTVRVEGVDAWDLSREERLAARRRIGMVFQQPNLFDASVRRNVEYGIHIRRAWSKRARMWFERLLEDRPNGRVVDALEIVGLDEAADRGAGSLSGGEAQRVAFARALAPEPDVLLLDEPTSDLDPRNTAEIESAIRTACERGVGVVVATHDMHQAERIADRVGVMINGKLIEIGPTDRVFDDPEDDRVQRFIDGDLVY